MSAIEVAEAPRSTWQSLKRGFVGRCPRCGKGHVFRAFLKVRDACEACGEPLHHHRADDAPPYVTMLIVTHVLGFIMVGVLDAYDDIPLWLQFILWPGLVLGLCLGLLPRVKGALIALQWAQRMHGFGGADRDDPVVL